MVSPTAEIALGASVKASSSTTPEQVRRLVARARVAQAVFESFSQEQVDAIVRALGKYVYDNAEEVARMAHQETGLGVYEDKVQKALGKARVIWNSLKGKPSRGIIGEDAEANLVLVAKPMGVVGAVCPVTNPIVTPMCNAMFALKAGNAVIFAPHPKAEEFHLVPDPGLPGDPRGARRPSRPCPDGAQRLRRDHPGADGGGGRGGGDRGRRHGAVSLLLRQALLRRGRGQRAGHHRPRRGPAGRRREDRRRRLLRQRHHLLARAVRAGAGGALRRNGGRSSLRPERCGSRKTRWRCSGCATSCFRTAT